MLNVVNRKRYRELKDLDIKQKSIYKEFCERCKCNSNRKENDKDSINTVKDLIFFVKDFERLKFIEFNLSCLVKNLPKYHEKENIQIYKEILDITKNRMHQPDVEFMYNTGWTDFPVLELLDYSKEISKLSDVVKERIIYMLKKSSSKYKILSIFMLSKKMKEINDEAFMNVIINFLYKSNIDINDEQLYNILSNCSNLTLNESFKNWVYVFLDAIDSEKDKQNDIYLNEFIKIIFDNYVINNIPFEEENSIIHKILNVLVNTTGKNENLEILIPLTDNQNFLLMENKVVQDKIVDLIMSLDKEMLEQQNLIVEIIRDIVIPCKNNTIKLDILNKLALIKSSKSLEMILDIYPFLSKYVDDNNKIKVIGELSNIDNLEYTEFNKVGISKKLIVPIQYKNDDIKEN